VCGSAQMRVAMHSTAGASALDGPPNPRELDAGPNRERDRPRT
jgi:hypothetical protein